MQFQLRSVVTAVVAAATAVCGLLMLGGVGPAADDAAPTGDRLPLVAAARPASFAEQSAPSGSADPPATESTSVPDTSVPDVQGPLPVSVAASGPTVGAGGPITFTGECPVVAGEAAGPVVVWVIAATTDAVDRIDTGVTAADWTYRWTAPTDPGLIGSYSFQFWCGEPDGWQGGYPSELQITIDMVAQVAPAAPAAPAESIPVTG